MSAATKSTSTLPPREWLNAREAAEWVGMSVDSIRNARAAGHLVAKVTASRGGKELYRVSELRIWIEGLDDKVGA